MRERLDRIARMRAARLAERRRETTQAAAARAEAEKALRDAEREIDEARDALRALNAYEAGAVAGAGAFELRERLARSTAARIRGLLRKRAGAARLLADREAALERARAAARAAERSVRQMETLEERVAEEEERLAELQEELQADDAPRRRGPFAEGAR